jgi:hypothetical protein
MLELFLTTKIDAHAAGLLKIGASASESTICPRWLSLLWERMISTVGRPFLLQDR